MARVGIRTITVFTVFLAVLYQKASALRCWQCDENKENCKDEFNPEKMVGLVHQQQCPDDSYNPPVCLKVKTATDGVRRDCATINTAAHACSLGKSTNKECITCNTDLCNGAARYGSIGLLIAVPVVIARVLEL